MADTASPTQATLRVLTVGNDFAGGRRPVAAALLARGVCLGVVGERRDAARLVSDGAWLPPGFSNYVLKESRVTIDPRNSQTALLGLYAAEILQHLAVGAPAQAELER